MAFSPEAAFEFLRRAHEADRLAHAYLIAGEAGSGKRALALRLAALVAGMGEGGGRGSAQAPGRPFRGAGIEVTHHQSRADARAGKRAPNARIAAWAQGGHSL